MTLSKWHEVEEGSAWDLRPFEWLRTILAQGEHFRAVRRENSEDGAALDKDLGIQFRVAIVNAWHKVLFTSAIMQPFEDEAQVDTWCE